MAELIRYLLLANIFLLALSLFFQLVLANERLFKLNRVVLLGGVALALVIPIFQLDLLAAADKALIVIPEMIASMPIFNVDIMLDEVQVYGTAPKVFPWINFSQIIYLSGIIIMGLLFVWRLRQIKQLQKSNPMKLVKDLFITLLPFQNSAFSFLGVVYFPSPLKDNDPTTSLILEHERAHIEQKHSWDILFIEIVKILFFYNPAVYSIKNQMELTHEYLADSVGAGAAPTVKQYSLALFRTFFQSPGLALSHGFKTSSTLKQRFLMLEKNDRKKNALLKYALLIPLTCSFLTLSAFTTVKSEKNQRSHPAEKTITEEITSIDDNNDGLILDTFLWQDQNKTTPTNNY